MGTEEQQPPPGAINDFTDANTPACGGNVTSLIPVATGDVDIVLLVPGTGAFSRQVADGSIASGTARGPGAVDLQTYRLANTKVASGACSFVGGGFDNEASGECSATFGGTNIFAKSLCSATVGGESMANYGNHSAIAGGFMNIIHTAEGEETHYCGIAGGGQNNIHGYAQGSAILGGAYNTLSGSTNIIAGGLGNTLAATPATDLFNSLIGGTQASCSHLGCFVWADGTGGTFASSATNQFRARASGGVFLRTSSIASGVSTGSKVLGGASSWSNYLSKSARKFSCPIDTKEVLDRLCSLQVYDWDVESGEERMIGPSGREFNRTFGLGDLEKDPDGVDSSDADGVNVTALIQTAKELYALQREIRELKRLWKQKQRRETRSRGFYGFAGRGVGSARGVATSA